MTAATRLTWFDCNWFSEPNWKGNSFLRPRHFLQRCHLYSFFTNSSEAVLARKHYELVWKLSAALVNAPGSFQSPSSNNLIFFNWLTNNCCLVLLVCKYSTELDSIWLLSLFSAQTSFFRQMAYKFTVSFLFCPVKRWIFRHKESSAQKIFEILFPGIERPSCVWLLRYLVYLNFFWTGQSCSSSLKAPFRTPSSLLCCQPFFQHKPGRDRFHFQLYLQSVEFYCSVHWHNAECMRFDTKKLLQIAKRQLQKICRLI